MARRAIGQGWSVELGPEFEERAGEDEGQYAFWSPVGGRTVYAEVYKTGGGEAEAALAELARDRGTRPARRLERRDGAISGEAWLMPEVREDGTEYWGLNTFTSHGKSVACVTMYFNDPGDEEWAREVWGSVQPGGVVGSRTLA